jgi:hypothetical protein
MGENVTRDEAARNSSQTATDCVIRATEQFGEDSLEIVTLIAMNREGDLIQLYSNARSEPEMFGMLQAALTQTKNMLEDEDE